MAKIYDDAFTVEGVILSTSDSGNGVGLFAGEEDPWLVTEGLPPGSVYFKADGTKYRKTGGDNTETSWTVGIDPNAGGGAANCFPFFKHDGTQKNIMLTGPSLPFFLASGLQHNIPLQSC